MVQPLPLRSGRFRGPVPPDSLVSPTRPASSRRPPASRARLAMLARGAAVIVSLAMPVAAASVAEMARAPSAPIVPR